MIARSLCRALLAGSLLIALPMAPAVAGIVFDPWNYSQNLLEAARALEQIQNQVTSLQNEAQMLMNEARNLQSLPDSSLQSINQSLTRTQGLINQAQGITFSVNSVESQYGQLYSGASLSSSDQALVQAARSRWQNSVSSFEDSLKIQAGVVQNLDATRSSISSLVTSSQSAVGSLQATQAGNQLVALQTQQLADLTAVVAAQSRAQAIEAARTTANQDQARVQFQRFLTPGAASSTTTVQMFH